MAIALGSSISQIIVMPPSSLRDPAARPALNEPPSAPSRRLVPSSRPASATRPPLVRTGPARRLTHRHNNVDLVHCVADSISFVDTAGKVGVTADMCLGSDDLPLMAYYDFTNHRLKVAHCNDQLCTDSTTALVGGSTGDLGFRPAIALNPLTGYGLITFYDNAYRDLEVATCSNIACTSVQVFTLDSNGDKGLFSSVAFDPVGGKALIAYMDTTNSDLKTGYCEDSICSGIGGDGPGYIVDSAGEVGYYNAIAFGADEDEGMTVSRDVQIVASNDRIMAEV